LQGLKNDYWELDSLPDIVAYRKRNKHFVVHTYYPINTNALMRFRRCAKLSQECLANEAGIEQSTVGRIETYHIKKCYGTTIIMLARVLRIRPEDLVL
jgi:DNA-binding XRE family transcriptional regulator